jgi:PrcB C-terminal
MLATLTAALLLGAPPIPEPVRADKDAPAGILELFAKESWYKDQKGDETEFVGVLSKIPNSPKPVSFGRINPFRLTMSGEGKKAVREVYAASHPDYFAPYVGKRIKLIGKAVDMEVEGQVHAEIWPARLELLDAEPVPEAVKETPDRIDILAANKVYMADPTTEKDFVGVLEKKKEVDTVGFVLNVEGGDKKDRVDVYIFDNRTAPLEPYAGKRVKITGKKVDGTIGSRPFSHILPSRLEVLPLVGDKPNAKELKMLARGAWKPVEGAAPVQLVIRSAEELARSHGQAEDKAKDEAVQKRVVDEACRLFKVETIDWKSQMIVVASAGAKPTGGYSVEITGLSMKDDVLIVHWRLTSPKPGDFAPQTSTHPAHAVLTERFDGKVVFEAPPPLKTPGGEK